MISVWDAYLAAAALISVRHFEELQNSSDPSLCVAKGVPWYVGDGSVSGRAALMSCQQDARSEAQSMARGNDQMSDQMRSQIAAGLLIPSTLPGLPNMMGRG